MMELADVADSKSAVRRARAGSSPAPATKSSMPRRIMAVRGLLMSDGRGSNPLEATIQNSIAKLNLV